MSVRRLADAAVQPDSFAFSKANGAWAKQQLKKYPEGRQASAVIPLLMRAQEQDGWVTKPAIEHVAEMLDMPLIRVLEVATFYTQFMLAPVGKRAHVQVCGTTPCMLRGSDEIIAVCKKRISPNQFELSQDGNLSWEEVECQGACVNAPMVMIFKDSYEDLTAERMEEIIDEFDAGRGADVPVGPQIDRIFAAPEGGLTSLNEKPTGKRPTRKNGKGAEEQAATHAARPASHVGGGTGEALSTPLSPAKAKAASKAADRKRAEADTGSPKARAEKQAKSLPADAKPAAFRDPKPEALKGKAKKPAPVKAKTITPKAAEPLSDVGRPAAIARPAEIDDLKLINGVGPKIEGILHSLGIYTFAQVAKWKKAERQWVDGYLRFGGRIERDDWVRQAKALAKGGRDEYVRVFGKEPK